MPHFPHVRTSVKMPSKIGNRCLLDLGQVYKLLPSFVMFASIGWKGGIFAHLTSSTGIMETSEFQSSSQTTWLHWASWRAWVPPSWLHRFKMRITCGQKEHDHCVRTSKNVSSLLFCGKIPKLSSHRGIIEEQMADALPQLQSHSSWNSLQDAVSLDSCIHQFK